MHIRNSIFYALKHGTQKSMKFHIISIFITVTVLVFTYNWDLIGFNPNVDLCQIVYENSDGSVNSWQAEIINRYPYMVFEIIISLCYCYTIYFINVKIPQ